jgi:hypothetical protein
MDVFVSVGSQYTEEQRAFVKAFDAFLVDNECRKLTVDDGRCDQPVYAARELMEKADAVIVLAFTRFLVGTAVEKPGSPHENPVANVRYPTIWNQMEAAMGFGLHLPLLVIIEEGLFQEAMLKDRLEFRTIVTRLDPALFSTDTFRKKFRHWMDRVQESGNRPVKNMSDYSVGQILSALKPEQVWKLGVAMVGLMAAVATTAFWLGQNLKQ